MRILFIAEPYMDLHLPIIKELEEQGNEVVYVQDIHPDFDWKESWRGKRDKITRHVKAIIRRSYQKYWDKKITCDDRFLIPFELILVINGCSFHPYLINRLKRISPKLKSILYLWDNSAFYDYFRNAKAFDKVMTFDMEDANKYNVGLLPFFFTKDMVLKPQNLQYLISTVGSNHNGRLEICRQIYRDVLQRFRSQMESNVIYNNLSIRGGKPLCFRIIDTLIPEDEIVTHKKLAITEVVELIKKSHCVLDTDRESQTGTTPRLIWALAMNKKIITTNENIVNFNFYDPKQILVINRRNPEIPDDFILSPLPDDFSNEGIKYLRIDRWIKLLIS